MTSKEQAAAAPGRAQDDSLLMNGVSKAVAERDADGNADDSKSPQADRLVKLVHDMDAELVHDKAGTPFVLVPRPDGRRGVHPLRSPRFNAFIANEYQRHFNRVPNPQAVSSARLVLEGAAVHQGRCEDVALRVAGSTDEIDVDLGDDDLRMVHITAKGWSIQPHGSRLFRRCPGMLALPEPTRGGDIVELRPFTRVDDNGFALMLCFLVSAFRGYGPYPILQIGGEHGSAKTTSARFLRALIDPNTVDVRGHCSDTRDLLIAANNGHLLIFDNLSSISSRTSDDLCRLSTGAGFTTRQLYTDQEEVIFLVQRPIILTGIPDLTGRADLSDRCLSVRQITISEQERQTERDLWERFEEARPRILGALFEALSLGLRRFSQIERATTSRMRMADAYVWSLSTAPALGLSSDEIKRAWLNTRDEAHALTLESSPIYEPLRTVVEPMLDAGKTWISTAAELLGELETADPDSSRKRDWPAGPRPLANEVRRIAPALRSVGIDHEELPRTSRKRLHRFSRPVVKEIQPDVIFVTSVIDGEKPAVLDDASPGDVSAHCHSEANIVTKDLPRDAQYDADDANDDMAASLYAGAFTTDQLAETEEEL